MAEKILRQLIDDIDGTEIAEGTGESVEFSIRGAIYRLDLSKPNVTKFDKALKPYIEAAEEVAKPRKAARRKRSNEKPKGAQLAEIRNWAKENGYQVASRGRINASVVEAFEAEH